MTAGEVEITGEPTVLYRLYSADGTLLYIGITRNTQQRFADHAEEKPWWPEVARKTMVGYGSREAAALAEGVAVRAEHPVHNVMLRKPPYVRRYESAGRPPIGKPLQVRLGKLHAAAARWAEMDGIKMAEWVRRAVEAEITRRPAAEMGAPAAQ